MVIGGGPAGAMASGLLAKKDFHVVLLEKERFPRLVVGESLIPHFWKFSDVLGASDRIARHGFVVKSGGLSLWNGVLRRLSFKPFGYDRPAYHVERADFDQLLLDASRERGTQVFEGHAVTSVEMTSDERAIVHYRRMADGARGTIAARYVVDGSGQAAVVARQYGFREFDDALRFTALWAYYRGGRFMTYEGAVLPYEQRFETAPATLMSSLGGWAWVWHIVQREMVSVGVVLPPDRLAAFKAGKDTPEEKLRAIVAKTPLTGKLMEGAEYIEDSFYAIRDYAYKPTRLAFGCCYLAGDAAAFADPINSAGVPFGMFAGFLAASAIDSSMRRESWRDYYRDSFSEQYGGRLQIFRMLAIPTDAEVGPEMVEIARRSVAMTSRAEQQLMLLQATLTQRNERVLKIFADLGLPDVEPDTSLPVPAL